MTLYKAFDSIVLIVGGIYGTLITQSVLPRNPKDPERMELWRRKFGRMMSVLCPIVVLWGVVKLFIN